MSQLLQAVEQTLATSESVQTNYELEYQSLTDTAYKYVGLFLSDADDDRLHNLVDELRLQTAKLGMTSR